MRCSIYSYKIFSIYFTKLKIHWLMIMKDIFGINILGKAKSYYESALSERNSWKIWRTVCWTGASDHFFANLSFYCTIKQVFEINDIFFEYAALDILHSTSHLSYWKLWIKTCSYRDWRHLSEQARMQILIWDVDSLAINP